MRRLVRRLDSSKRCLDYLSSVSGSISSMKDLLSQLFHRFPSVKFAVDLMNYIPVKHFQADELVLFFLHLDQHRNAIQFVEQLMHSEGAQSGKEEANKLQTCFDLLRKYSYLVDDKVWPTMLLFSSLHSRRLDV